MVSPAVASIGHLLERETYVELLTSVLEHVRSGDGRIVLVEGEAGIGKTALLEVVRERALGMGCTVLAGRGGELERDFAHGVARQLFEPVVHGADAHRRDALLSGAARLAAPVLGLARERPGERPAGDAGFAANHGLYWLTANLAESGEVLIVVDDVQWVDAATLLFLNYVGRRLDGLPVLIALGLRTGDPAAPPELLEPLRRLPDVESLTPPPLGEEAAGVLIERLLGSVPDAAFRVACHEVTGGNPFLLEELLRALGAEGVEPRDEAAERVLRLAPRSISRSVLGRLGAMGPEALALAKAVSVLDTDAELRYVAGIAGLDRRAAESAADALTGAHILAPGRPLRFSHPIMRQAVYEDLPGARRAADHARAARLLDSVGGDPDRAAVHLLPAEPAADAWVVDRLRAAAARALARGAPDAATVLLQRALAEPPPREESAVTLAALGRAERLAGAPDAPEHLYQALEQATDPALRAEAARELATALATGARLEEAVQLLERAIEQAADRETALLLEADLFGLSQASDELAARVAPRLERVCEGMRGETRGERLALAANVFHRTFVGLGSGDEVAEIAHLAWGEGRLLQEATGDHFAFYGPLIALRDSDHHEELRPMFAEAIADAQARGSAAAVALTLATFARLEQADGNLAGAEAAGRSALEAAQSSAHYQLVLPLALSSLVLPLVERGEVDSAEEIIATHGLDTGPPPPTTTGNPFLAARAKLRLAQGRIAESVADTSLWLERQRLRGGLNPVGASSILNPALPFLAAGDRATAQTLAHEMLTVAERWGVAGHTGSCLVVVSVVTGGESGVEGLRAGVELLGQSPRQLELAHGLVELGAALRRANRRSDARGPLSRGMELAHRCGAVPLVDRARAELRATGARPRRLVFTGAESLTAQERRVAEMAANGLSNPEIAQALFVTRRTIETHLRHAYQKLGIGGREELRQALEADEP